MYLLFCNKFIFCTTLDVIITREAIKSGELSGNINGVDHLMYNQDNVILQGHYLYYNDHHMGLKSGKSNVNHLIHTSDDYILLLISLAHT